MINTFGLVSRRSVHQLRQIHKCVVRLAETNAAATTEAQSPLPPPPPPSNVDKPVSPKIDKIANDITALNLIEVAELSDLLKKRLNLPDAPAMPVVAAVAQAAEEEEVQKKVQTAFTVRMLSFDDKQKVALIKTVKSLLPDMNLVQAKKFIESVPMIVKADMVKTEAEELKDALVKVGATIEIV